MKRAPIIAAISLLVAVGLIALVVRAGWTVAFDRGLMERLAPPAALVPAVRAVSWLGNSLTRFALAAVAALILLVRRDRRRALLLAVVVLGGAAFNSALKLVVARPRPDLLAHLDHVTTASFPSGHSAGAVATYGGIALLLLGAGRGGLIAATLLALAIGVSRVMLAVHWPSDVLAGWCAGAAWLLLWWNKIACARAG